MKGHIRRRGKGSWAIVLDIGRDAGGRRQQRWHTVHGTKRDAEAELARLLTSLNTGAYVEPNRMTVADYLDRWLADYARTNVAPKTFERYAEIIRLHLALALGAHLLAKLQPLHVQAYYSAALREGRRDGKGGLSARTVLHHHRVLREALQQAVRWQLLVRNPVDAVEPPRPQRREAGALDEGQAARILAAAEGTPLHLPVLVGLTTGMRRGEILALRWEDIDLGRAVLAVRQSLEQTRDGLAFKAPKTAKGRRTITLPPIAVEALRRRKREQAQERLMLGPAYQDAGLVACRPDGRPCSPSATSKAFAQLARATGLPDIHFHTLRHTHATMLLQQGVAAKVVSERLGHSTVGITLDVYSHVLPNLQEEAARRVEAALRAALRTTGAEHRGMDGKKVRES